MSCPIEVLIGATKPILMFRASGEGAGFVKNSKAATVEMIITIITAKAIIFLFKYTSLRFFLSISNDFANKIN